MSGWTIAWLLWLGAFVVVEGLALFNKKPGDTLSEHVWSWFAIKDSSAPYGQAKRCVLLFFVVWLGAHFVTGGWV